MVDYAEIICQAVDEIVSKRLESINYDNTITCSIVDIKDAKTGAYIVTDGSTNFTAYSLSTEYKVNDVVYITVPNNDFTKQKIIIGKRVTNDTTPFIFTTPFDTIVDVSTNLIHGDKKMRSLIANNPDIPPKNPENPEDEYEIHGNVKKLIWEKDFGDSMLVGFTRLGVQGQFRSWLKSFSAKSGDYGYRLILTCERDNHETTVATSKRVLKKLTSDLTEAIWGEIQTSDEINWPNDMILSWAEYNILSTDEKNIIINKMANYLKSVLKDSYAKYDLYLSSADMYGDPYNFQSFYQQEKVFDISNLGKIINMKLEFYQTPETFYSSKPINQKVYDMLPLVAIGDEEDRIARWKEVQSKYRWPEQYALNAEQIISLNNNELDSLIAEMRNYLTLVPYEHPLFTTLLDPNLFDKDPYICVGYDLNSFDKESAVLYTIDSSTYRAGLSDKENTKQVWLRWLHLFDDGQIKAVSQKSDLDYEIKWYRYELGHPTVDGYAGVNWMPVENNNSFSYSFLPNIEEAEEKVKAVIIYEGNPIYSNILTFENERPVNNPATLDQIYGLNLWCADNSYGNYRIYNLGGELEDSDARNHIRDLECHFDSKETEASGLLTDATWIMWRIPASSTMLKIASSEYSSNYTSSNIEEMPKFTSIEDVDWKTKVPFSIAGTKYFDGIWSDYMYDATTDEIVSIWKGNSANGFFINPLLEYKIESFYSPSNSNNTITCIIYKNGVQYETQKEFTFGPVGNSGTDWSFEIDFDNNETALTSGNEKSISLTARLYDRNNKDVTYDMLFDDDLNADTNWDWYKDTYNPSGLQVIDWHEDNSLKKNEARISIPNNTTIDMNSLLYVQCKLEGVGNTSLVAILPIPIRKWINDQKHYSHVTGTDFVVYPSSGYPHYYNNPFKTHIVTKTDNTSIVQSVEKGGQWKLFNPHNEFEVYIGNITDKNVLQPAAIYTANVKQYGVQYLYNGQVCWTQPIFTMQNNYPSRALNEWDGKEIKIDYDNGTIIAPAIAAGKKNADNTFSGVMLGDWSANDVEGELKQQTGIYGFEHGAMSYAFKEDGSAFIGKSGFARIKFDGNESTIASESYTSGRYGMMIDLDDGFIDILGGKQTGIKNISVNTDNNRVGNQLTQKTFQTTGARVQLGISGSPYFKIISDNAHNHIPLIEISNNAYYLQSDDYSSGNTGMFINLDKGEILAHTFTLSADGLRLSTTSPYFQIDGSLKTLIYMGEDDYYLQSNNYKSGSKGMKIDLDDGSLYAYNFTLEADGDGAFVKISSKQSPYFQVSTSEENGKNLIYIGSNGYYLQSADYSSGSKGMYINLDDGEILAHTFTLLAGNGKIRLSTTNPYFKIDGANQTLIYIADNSYYLQSNDYKANSSGMHINLANGQILAYNFYLKASSAEKGSIIINSADKDYPLQIGSHFKIGWDGGIVGNKWSITSGGVAKFGGWSFNGDVMSNSGNEIKLQNGSLVLNANGALNIFATAIAAGAAGTASFSDIIVLGSIDNTELNNTLKNHESRLQALEDELVAARATIKSQASIIASLESELSAWEGHVCPTPDTGGGSGSSSEPSGPSNNT